MTSWSALEGVGRSPEAWRSPRAPLILVGDESADALALARLLAIATDGAVLQSTEPAEEAARRRHPGLIVVRSSPRRATRADLDALVRKGPCPVAIAPPGYASNPPDAIGQVGVALDGRSESRIALREALDIAAGCAAEMCLLIVTDPHSAAAAQHRDRPDDWLTGHRTLAERYLSNVVRELPHGIPVRHRALDGQVAPALAKAAYAEGLDLLALGSRRRGPIASVALGSVSHVLLRDPPCPLLICPRGAGSGRPGR
jgi:nucleotide-binding universal stress UspA family protein